MRTIGFFLLILMHTTNASASISVDYTCQFTQAGINAATSNPIDKVLTRMHNNDAENQWQNCAVGGASALTFIGNTPRTLVVQEKNCEPKVFKLSLTPAAGVNLSSNLNHHNTRYRRWNIDNNPKASILYTPTNGDKTAVDIPSSKYTLMWIGTCEEFRFTMTPSPVLFPERGPICAR